ncbi:MAG: hypothetical protein OJF51_002584 [Nitrospira sp.]|nr:MAG: hypothetical protein OJF51_002584 [Nitrospira sp.]
MALRDSDIHKAVASFDIPTSESLVPLCRVCRTVAHLASVDSSQTVII